VNTTLTAVLPNSLYLRADVVVVRSNNAKHKFDYIKRYVPHQRIDELLKPLLNKYSIINT